MAAATLGFASAKSIRPTGRNMATSQRKKILLVEDERETAGLVAEELVEIGRAHV